MSRAILCKYLAKAPDCTAKRPEPIRSCKICNIGTSFTGHRIETCARGKVRARQARNVMSSAIILIKRGGISWQLAALSPLVAIRTILILMRPYFDDADIAPKIEE